ncbi:MAG: GNAT family N-acetyltransferase [Geminicoccaceae bacterium]|nr:GNAT family N-acetyltransferase [Geminicoccaceae bacterium]
MQPTSDYRALTIRRAKPQDAEGIAQVYVDSWRKTYRGTIAQSYLDNLSVPTFERHWRRTFAARGWAFVAEVDGEIVGVSSGGRCRRQNVAAGELYVLYLDEAFHRRGFGRALFDACHNELARRGMSGTLVWVLQNNPARGFYERLGGKLVAESEIKIGGTALTEVAYHWPD